MCGYCNWILKSNQIPKHSFGNKEETQLLVVDDAKRIFIKGIINFTYIIVIN